MSNIKHIVLVLSGKGGVGKSTVSTQLALTFKEKGYRVGLLDIDLCGPSIPYLLKLEGQDVYQADRGWVPVYADPEQKLSVMSIGFLLGNRNNSIVWRGPKKTAMIQQLLSDVYWGNLDCLIIDTPPGTSDEHIAMMEGLKSLKCDGAILVTTPQQVSTEDVRKEITFCRKTGIPIIGIIENMSGFVCPHCSDCTNIFSKGGGEALAQVTGVPFLGALPIDPRVGDLLGVSYVKKYPDTPMAGIFNDLVDRIAVD